MERVKALMKRYRNLKEPGIHVGEKQLKDKEMGGDPAGGEWRK